MRRIHFAGLTPYPDTARMMQIGRNLTDPVEGFLRDKRFVIMDRDSKYSEAFRPLLENAGVEPVRLPPRSPNLNAFAERFVRSAREDGVGEYRGDIECRERMVGMLWYYCRAAA